jgi:hypothetical protein
MSECLNYWQGQGSPQAQETQEHPPWAEATKGSPVERPATKTAIMAKFNNFLIEILSFSFATGLSRGFYSGRSRFLSMGQLSKAPDSPGQWATKSIKEVFISIKI